MTKILDKLTLRAKEEINKLVHNKENAIDMIINNYYESANYSASDVCSRLQVQHFALNPSLNTLQTEGKDGWWQKEDYEPNTVNKGLFPIVETETTEEEWGKQYFSSFALKEVDGFYNIKYPLKDDYTSSISPFLNLEMTDENYKELVTEVQNKLKVKIVNGNVPGFNLYKRSLISLATIKIKNTGLKLIKKLENVTTAFKGKLILASKTKSNYKYTNIEKSVKIYDSLFKVGITRLSKYTKRKERKTISKDIQFASRLFADILMSRIIVFGDTNINKKVEKCLALQFANILNKNNFSSNQLNLITALASNVVVDTCKKLGYSKENIMQKMVINGYQYPKVPENEKEALLLAHEKDYSAYMSSLNNEEEAVSNTELHLTTEEALKKMKNAENFLNKILIKQNNNTKQRRKTTLPTFTEGVKTAALNAGVNQNLLPAGIVPNALPRPNAINALIASPEKLLLPQAKKKQALPKPEERPALASPKQKQELKQNGVNINFIPKPALPEGKSDIVGVLESGIKGYLSAPTPVIKSTVVYKNTTNNRFHIDYKKLPYLIEKEPKQEDKKEVKTQMVINVEGNVFGEKTIAKHIDNEIESILSNLVIKATNASNANRNTYGNKEKTKKLVEFLSTALCYFKKSTKKPIKITKASSLNDATLYSRSRQFVGALNAIKSSTINGIMKQAKENPPKKYEKVKTYVNRLSKNVCKAGEPEGIVLKKYFEKYILNVAKIYVSGNFEDIHENKD